MAESDEKEDPVAAEAGPEPEDEGLGEELEALVDKHQEEPALPEPTREEASGLAERPAAPAPRQDPAGARTENAGQTISLLRRHLAEKEAEFTKVVAAYRKLKEESEGFRKRMEQLQRRRFEQSKNDFIARFVEVLDNLDRAIDAIENNFDSDSVLQGIILVRSRLVALLREEGLEKIFVGGQPFDPIHSEAAGIETVDDESQDNVVIKEVQRGYMLKGSLLRPSRVIVGRYPRTDGAPQGEPSPAGGKEDDGEG